MTVNKERLQLGLDALRSDEFEQGTGALRVVLPNSLDFKSVTKYCCLGVLTEVAIRNGLTISDYCVPCQWPAGQCAHAEEGTEYTSDIWELNTGTLSEPVRQWYGFDRDDPQLGHMQVTVSDRERNTSLMATVANDEIKWDFRQIADSFEKLYLTPEADGAARPTE